VNDRCDRILWKTTVVPPKPQVGNSRRRPSLKLWAPNSRTVIRRSTSLSQSERSIQLSTNSTDNDVTANPPKLDSSHVQAQLISPSISQPGINNDGPGIAGLLTKLLPRNNSRSQSPIQRSITIDVPASTTFLNGIGKSVTQTGRPRKNSDSSVVRSQTRLDTTPGLLQPPSGSTTPRFNPNNYPSPNLGTNLAMRWLLGLLPGRDPAPAPVSNPTEKKDASLPVIHYKGEVICCHYGTLDDSAMRRLEGRSDHRPILGTFSVYI
jgi:hypothetical protein